MVFLEGPSAPLLLESYRHPTPSLDLVAQEPWILLRVSAIVDSNHKAQGRGTAYVLPRQHRDRARFLAGPLDGGPWWRDGLGNQTNDEMATPGPRHVSGCICGDSALLPFPVLRNLLEPLQEGGKWGIAGFVALFSPLSFLWRGFFRHLEAEVPGWQAPSLSQQDAYLFEKIEALEVWSRMAFGRYSTWLLSSRRTRPWLEHPPPPLCRGITSAKQQR